MLHGQLERAVGRADLADHGLVGQQFPGAVGPLLPAGHPQRHHVAGDTPLELVGRALGRDHPVIDDEHPVAQDVRFLQVVRGEEDRGAQLGLEPGDVLPQVAPALRVQAGGRLVQEDQRRPVHQPERDLQPPALPAGQRLDQPLLEPGQLKLRGQQFRPLPRLGGADAVQRGLVQQLLDDQAGRVGAAHRLADGLRHVADLLAHVERVRQQVGARHRGRPRGGLEQRGQHAQGSGLARAVRPEETDDLALADGQVHAPDRLDRALAALEGSRQPPCLDDRHRSPALRPGQVSRSGARDVKYYLVFGPYGSGSEGSGMAS